MSTANQRAPLMTSESDIRQVVSAFILEQVLQKPDFPLSDDTSLIEGGIIDSFAIVDIALFIESHFKMRIPDHELEIENVDSVASISRLIIATLLATQQS